MAYNPFNVFRRNQKGLFAVLTVFVMIMFVLSFGQGDFFQWLPSLFRSSKAKGEVMVKVDGDKIRQGDLEEIQRDRNLVGEFMEGSVAIAAEKVNQDISAAVADNRVSSSVKEDFLDFLRARNSDQYRYLSPKLAGFLQQQRNMDPRQFIEYSLQMYQSTFSKMTREAAKESQAQDVEMAQKALDLMNLDLRRNRDRQFGYFGNKVAEGNEMLSAFEFKLWLLKAEQLGIKMTGKDAKEIYFNELYKSVEDVALAEFEKFRFAERRDYSRDKIFTALANEFKVRYAQNAVLGRGDAPQVFESAWDHYDAFRKACDGANFVVFSVPSANYISKVTGKPSESELRKLFEQYQNKEPDPKKDNLGLVEPRKLKVAWIAATGNEPYFVAAGENFLKLGDLQARVRLLGAIPFPGLGYGLLAAPAVFNTQDPGLYTAYKAQTFEQSESLNYGNSAKFFDTNAHRRAGVGASPTMSAVDEAQIISALGGALATRGSPLMLPSLVLAERAKTFDLETRARIFAAKLLLPGEIGGHGIGAALAGWARLPNMLPFETVRQEIADKLRKDAIRRVANQDFNNFTMEVMKLGMKPDKKEVDDYVKKFADERALTTKAMTEFRDLYSFADDENLAPLVKLERSGHAGMNMNAPFGNSFFFEPDFRNMNPQMAQQPKMVPAKSLFYPQKFPENFSSELFRDDQTTYLTWRTAEQPSETPKSFKNAEAKVEALWRKIEARKLAEKDAADWAEKTRNMVKSTPADGDFATKLTVNFDMLHKQYVGANPAGPYSPSVYFHIPNVSPLSISDRELNDDKLIPPVTPFELRPVADQPKAMPYPTGEMQAQLIDARDQPEGSVLVMHDQSKDRYYVALLQNRNFGKLDQQKRFQKFYAYALEKVNQQISRALNEDLTNKARQDLVKNAMELLKAEFKVTDESEKLQPKKPKNEE